MFRGGDEDCGGTVGYLRGRSGGHSAVFFENGLEFSEFLQRRVGPDAFVITHGRQRSDFFAERPRDLRFVGLGVTGQGELVHLGSFDAVFRGYQFRGHALVEWQRGGDVDSSAVGESFPHRGTVGPPVGSFGRAGVGAHGDPRHGFDSGGNYQVGLAGDDGGGRRMQRLLAGATLSVDGGRRYRERPASRQNSIAAHVPCLFTDLRYAAHHYVVDRFGFYACLFDDGVEYVRSQVNRVRGGQGSASFPQRGANGGHNNCFCHKFP